jgi:hypothetical protein
MRSCGEDLFDVVARQGVVGVRARCASRCTHGILSGLDSFVVTKQVHGVRFPDGAAALIYHPSVVTLGRL